MFPGQVDTVANFETVAGVDCDDYLWTGYKQHGAPYVSGEKCYVRQDNENWEPRERLYRATGHKATLRHRPESPLQ